MDLGPSTVGAFPVLTPLFGFASISGPEMTNEMFDIPEGNWYFPRHVIKRTEVGSITLTRGTRFFDSDFWRWMLSAVTGETSGFQFPILPFLKVGGPTPRRDLLLIQYFPKVTLGSGFVGDTLNIAAAAGAGGIAGQGITSIANLAAFNALFSGVQAAAGVDEKIGPLDFAARVPAKMWLLRGCLPQRYKTGDFDASSGAVSLSELDLAIESFEEMALTA